MARIFTDSGCADYCRADDFFGLGFDKRQWLVESGRAVMVTVRRLAQINQARIDNLNKVMNCIFHWREARGMGPEGDVFELVSFRTGAGRKSRGTNLKFQIGDFRGRKGPDFACLWKHLIFRRLRSFWAFFGLFLSQKGLISRRLQGFRGKISHQRPEYELTQRRKDAETQRQAEPALDVKIATILLDGQYPCYGARPEARGAEVRNAGQKQVAKFVPRCPGSDFLTQRRKGAETRRAESDAWRRVTTLNNCLFFESKRSLHPASRMGRLRLGSKLGLRGEEEGCSAVLTRRTGGLRVAAYRSCGEPTGGSESESQRLRVSRRSAADPLNLLRIMPAKGVTSVTAIFAQRPIGNCVAALKLCGSHFLFADSSGAIREVVSLII
jgi:hypothetical protein